MHVILKYHYLTFHPENLQCRSQNYVKQHLVRHLWIHISFKVLLPCKYLSNMSFQAVISFLWGNTRLRFWLKLKSSVIIHFQYVAKIASILRTTSF